MTATIAKRAVAAARLIALDAIEEAESGHPGAALSLAPVADLLFHDYIRHDPKHPDWIGRDRFILSCGHASMLLYAQLYLTGYDVSMADLKSFRRLHSRTPGHPEYRATPGVEATTGPLGQGFATAVGMAMAFAHQRAVYDPEAAAGTSPFDRRVWVLASDGDLQEGISYEAGALAGRHQLSNLTLIYDDNDIQIEGSVSLAWSEDRAARFASQGWGVSRVGRSADGDIDVAALDAALSAQDDGRPHLVVVKSEIAWPAPTARGRATSHGAPLGAEEVRRIRDELGVGNAPFEIDDEVLAYTRRATARGRELHSAWDQAMASWETAHPKKARTWQTAVSRVLPSDLADDLPRFIVGSNLATRDASGRVIQVLAERLPDFIGGSADLAEPNRTEIRGSDSFLPEGTQRLGRNIHWGVREHAMAAAMNGMLLAGGLRVFAGTFLVFSDYQRPAIRLAALMELSAIYVWTHDSIALGQDGPTHQPIEHLASLRAIPGMTVIRPADANETAAAWLVALEQKGPTGLVLCRQPLRTLNLPPERVLDGVRRGAYAVDEEAEPDVLLIATGSELELALDAADRLRAAGSKVRVVSMPSRELFERQDRDFRESVIPAAVRARVVVEAASRYGWGDLAGECGVIVGVDRFGVSGPARDVQRELGLTVEAVLSAAHDVMAARTE